MKRRSYIIVIIVILLCLNTTMNVNAISDSHLHEDDNCCFTLEDYLAGNIPDNADINSISTHPMRSQLFDNGTYYINGEYSGDYLKYSTSSVCAESGLLSSLGNYIKWNIKCINSSNNIYTISSYGDSTKYLGATVNAGNVEYVNVSSGSSIPNRCKWYLSTSAIGGCLIKNYYNSQYLYSWGTTVYTSTTTGTSGTSTYKTRVWRIPDIDYISGKELNSNFSIKTCYLFTGEEKSPSINKSPSNAIWASPTDFTYSGINYSYFSYNSLTGKFSTNSSAHYYSSITATHKVTNRSTTFSITINPKAILMGISNTGHDHSSCLTSITSFITNCKYSAALTYFGSYSTAAVDGFLNTDCNNIFVSRSHGGIIITTPSGTQVGTFIQLNDDDDNMVIYSSRQSIKNLELSNMKLVMFIGCETGVGGENGLNLPTVAVSRGATTSVGFSQSIGCAAANNWTIDFFDLLEDGLSVSAACLQLDGNTSYSGTSLTSHVICGYKYTKIN